MNEIKLSKAPNCSDDRAQRRNPSSSNTKEESKEISMIIIRESGRRGARGGGEARSKKCVLSTKVCRQLIPESRTGNRKGTITELSSDTWYFKLIGVV